MSAGVMGSVHRNAGGAADSGRLTVPLANGRRGISHGPQPLRDRGLVRGQAVRLRGPNDAVLEPRMDLVAAGEQLRARRRAYGLRVGAFEQHAVAMCALREVVQVRSANRVLVQRVVQAKVVVAEICAANGMERPWA